ncbi:mRNA splicing protein SYF1 KNAG_0C04410 [Huiozyma naganishii CBS 8797]|uniref:Pre-mRNA-splicing factor SYF1 n=1 Tax=Huiozyma naganishii (strain ATCC MYA-139 / BCRC 22969 / CBS 8797 / KCTC 17520 / NBRC 10181 / NCYC 3082 / Yp74L-3) TaxID=1071383 RepID=J7RJ53_HUIN7|nr:hypothetical protein KNAG_0C04410 [Kazachstania naganishii CBS 8797]CCK69543.1 hypothetical protein KNAG_0C04410 [Kazachstania naganishii CBS 8797]
MPGKQPSKCLERYLQDKDDIAFEYELQKDDTNLVTWQRYLDHWKAQYIEDKDKRPLQHIIWLYERLVAVLYEDIDVWYDYICWIFEHRDSISIKFISGLYKRCLEQVKAPSKTKRLTLDTLCVNYMKFAVDSLDLTVIRSALDQSLGKITKKQSRLKIWEILISFLQNKLIPLTETAFEGSDFETQYEKLQFQLYTTLFGDKLQKVDQDGDIWSAQMLKRYLIICPRDRIFDTLALLARTFDYHTIKECFDKYLFKNNNDRTSLSMQMIYLRALERLNLETAYQNLLRALKQNYPEENIKLLTEETSHYIKLSKLDELCMLLTDELSNTLKFKDFFYIYNYQIDFEQAYNSVVIQELESGQIQNKTKWETILGEHMTLLESHIESYDMKLSDLKLRQNPHNIDAWKDRVNLFATIKEKCEVYSQALVTIDPLNVYTPRAFGSLWCDYATVYWTAEDYDSAREIFDTAIKVPFPYLQDLELIYANWIEKEVKLLGVERGCNMLSSILKIPDQHEVLIEKFYSHSKTVPAQTVLFNSLKLWTMYLDFLEASSNVNGLILAYEQIISLKLVTPLLITSYAQFLQTIGQKEETYKVLQRGIDLFHANPTILFQLWVVLLHQIVDDEDIQTKREEYRDSFEQALSGLNDKVSCEDIYLLYHTFEEKLEQRSTMRAIDILRRGANSIPQKFTNSKLKLWDMALSEMHDNFGAVACRPIYEECIPQIPIPRNIKHILQFVQLETEQKEYKRVRELFSYGAQLVPPSKNEDLWKVWDQFEIEHGDRESYRDMLKLKKKLESELKVDTETVSQAEGGVRFVTSTVPQNRTPLPTDKSSAVSNPEEIDIDI